MLQQFDLSGKRYVITGASSGIGQALSEYLAAAGATVLLLARREQRLQQAVEQLNARVAQTTQDDATTNPATYLVADLTARQQLTDIAAECLARLGRVDGVVNAAGVNRRETEEQISLASWDYTLNLNLAVPFFFAREFIPGMRANGYGRIVNIASLQSSRAFENGLAYGASKGGVCQLTRAMARAWSRHGITCNAIAPGFFPTELTAAVFSDPDKQAAAAAQTCIGRNGVLSDLAGAVIFFASEAAGFVTGQTLYVDGGFTAK